MYFRNKKISRMGEKPITRPIERQWYIRCAFFCYCCTKFLHWLKKISIDSHRKLSIGKRNEKRKTRNIVGLLSFDRSSYYRQRYWSDDDASVCEKFFPFVDLSVLYTDIGGENRISSSQFRLVKISSVNDRCAIYLVLFVSFLCLLDSYTRSYFLRSCWTTKKKWKLLSFWFCSVMSIRLHKKNYKFLRRKK